MSDAPPPPQPVPPPPYGAPGPPVGLAPGRAPLRTWDVVLTSLAGIVIVLAGGFVMLASIASLIAVSGQCLFDDTVECSPAPVLLGALVVALSPWIALSGPGSWAVLRLGRGRSAWWLPWLAVPLWVPVVLLGLWLVDLGAPHLEVFSDW